MFGNTSWAILAHCPESEAQPLPSYCQAQPNPQPANLQLGAEIALISQLSWTTHQPTQDSSFEFKSQELAKPKPASQAPAVGWDSLNLTTELNHPPTQGSSFEFKSQELASW